MRLIDIDAFKERFKKEHEGAFNSAEARAVRSVFAELEIEPTAYDVEKVVEQVHLELFSYDIPSEPIEDIIRKGGVE